MYTVNFSSFETQSHTAVVVVVFTAGVFSTNLTLDDEVSGIDT